MIVNLEHHLYSFCYKNQQISIITLTFTDEKVDFLIVPGMFSGTTVHQLDTSSPPESTETWAKSRFPMAQVQLVPNVLFIVVVCFNCLNSHLGQLKAWLCRLNPQPNVYSYNPTKTPHIHL